MTPERRSCRNSAAVYSVVCGGQMPRDEEDQILEALRLDWDEVYEIDVGPDGFRARHRNGVGETMIHPDPGELRRQIREDFSLRPPFSS
jgi:hypothetical protein